MKNQGILSFLGDLGRNNTRSWMDENRDKYQLAKSDFESLINEIIQGTKKVDSSLEGLEAKKCIFRLHRDIRFSKDKTPYKTNFGAAIQQDGRKSSFPGYYIHLKPGGESFAGGGMYMPSNENLNKIRQEIDYNPDPILNFLDSKEFKEVFKEMYGERLKTSPKGFSKDHPHIELLRLKSFVLTRQFKDKDVIADGFSEKVIETFRMLKPLNDYLNLAIST